MATEEKNTIQNIDIEKYISELSPELQEKARACTNTDELLKFAGDNKIPLPDEALEAVAGGKGSNGPDRRLIKISQSWDQDENRVMARYEAVCQQDGKTAEWELNNTTFAFVRMIRDDIGISTRRADLEKWGREVGSVSYSDPSKNDGSGRIMLLFSMSCKEISEWI